MAVDSSSYVSLEFCKAYAGDEGIDADTDDFLCDLINNVSRFIDTYTGRKLYRDTYTELYSGDMTDKLIPDNYPIISVTSLYDDTYRVYPAETLIIPTDYGIVRDRWIQLYYDFFQYDINNVKITYVAGFEEIPKDLQEACAEIVMWKYKEARGGGDLNIQSKSRVDTTTTYKADAIPKAAKDVLDLYRRLVA